MKPTLKHAIAVVLLVLSLAAPAAAGPLEDASAAYQRADYATEYLLLRPLADGGNAKAQASLGFMYSQGRGVPKDYGETIKWYRRAAAQGYAKSQVSLG